MYSLVWNIYGVRTVHLCRCLPFGRPETTSSPHTTLSFMFFIISCIHVTQYWKSNWSPPSLPIWMSIIKSSISKRCCKGSMLQILQVCDCPWYLLQIYMIWYDMQLCRYDTQTCKSATVENLQDEAAYSNQFFCRWKKYLTCCGFFKCATAHDWQRTCNLSKLCNFCECQNNTWFQNMRCVTPCFQNRHTDHLSISRFLLHRVGERVAWGRLFKRLHHDNLSHALLHSQV